MVSLRQMISITVTEPKVQNGRRAFEIRIEGRDDIFFLADSLVKAGALKDLPSELKRACRKAIGYHINSGKELVLEVRKAARKI